MAPFTGGPTTLVGLRHSNFSHGISNETEIVKSLESVSLHIIEIHI